MATNKKTCLSRRDSILLNRLRIGHTHLTHSYLLSCDNTPKYGTNSEAHPDGVC